MIPLVDLKVQHESLRVEISEAIDRVVRNANFIMGPEVEGFEKDLGKALNATEVVGVASGTAALFLSLAALGIGIGDEVITTPLTFIATVEAILQTGARPVFVDIDPRSYNIDAESIEDWITDNTRAIVPVHLYGQPADMNVILQIAKAYNLMVVGDAAQALGASYCGQEIAQYGDAVAFSFYPGKNVGALGDAGAVVTKRKDVADKVRLLRDHGREAKYVHKIAGYGERLDALQAAILRVKLKYLDDWNNRRKKVANVYWEGLCELPLVLPSEMEGSNHVYHLYVVRLRSKKERDVLREYLQKLGISTGIHYPIPLHLQPALINLGYKRGDFPKSETTAETILSLPMYPELTTDQQQVIIEAIRDFYG